MCAEVFTLLGMIIDATISDTPVFFATREGDTYTIECDDMEIITRMILPLCYDKVYQHLENCSWYVAIIKISPQPQYHITEITIENDLGESIECCIGEELLNILAERGIDDIYLKICQEFTKCVIM